MSELYGVCKFCGQVTASPEWIDDQADADAWATENCDCPGGLTEKKRKETIVAAKERVDDLFGADCEDYGFPERFGTDRVDFLKAITDAVGHELLDGAKLNFACKGTAEIKRTADGKIKVVRTIGRKCTLEA